MATKDPLSIFHDGLWTVLEANAALATMVRKEDRIKFVDDAAYTPAEPARPIRIRDIPQPIGYAQVAIDTAGGESRLYASSDGTHLLERFTIWARTGDDRFYYLQDGEYHGILPVRWEILRAMANWEAHLKPLTWNSKGFIHDCSVYDAAASAGESPSHPAMPPNRWEGWSLAWRGEAELVFTSADLIPA